MKKIIKRSCILLGLFLSVYLALAVYTAPDSSIIEGCPETSIHKIKLCADNPNYVALDDVSEIAVLAIINSEDIGFYKHHGFDVREIIKSIQKNFWHLQWARGGSTITQQVVKNVFLNEHKTLHRKIQEAYLTLRLEGRLNKRQILEKYLNVIELGPNIFGIKQAAEYYFHKNAKDLTTLDSAYLAHLLPNPKLYSKSFQQQKLKGYSRSRVLRICWNLWYSGYISANEYLSFEKSIDDFPWNPAS